MMNAAFHATSAFTFCQIIHPVPCQALSYAIIVQKDNDANFRMAQIVFLAIFLLMTEMIFYFVYRYILSSYIWKLLSKLPFVGQFFLRLLVEEEYTIHQLDAGRQTTSTIFGRDDNDANEPEEEDNDEGFVSVNSFTEWDFFSLRRKLSNKEYFDIYRWQDERTATIITTIAADYNDDVTRSTHDNYDGYRHNDNNNNNDDEKMKRDCCCVICLEEFQSNDVVARLKSCQHEFHEKCLFLWLQQQHRQHQQQPCPCCRTRLKKKCLS